MAHWRVSITRWASPSFSCAAVAWPFQFETSIVDSATEITSSIFQRSMQALRREALTLLVQSLDGHIIHVQLICHSPHWTIVHQQVANLGIETSHISPLDELVEIVRLVSGYGEWWGSEPEGFLTFQSRVTHCSHWPFHWRHYWQMSNPDILNSQEEKKIFANVVTAFRQYGKYSVWIKLVSRQYREYWNAFSW